MNRRIKKVVREIRVLRTVFAYYRARVDHYQEVKENINRFKSACSFITKLPSESCNGKTALVLSLTSFIYSVKLEIMLALGLKLVGWNIVFVCNETDYWTLRLIKWSRLGKVILLEDYFRIGKHLDIKADQYIKGELDFPSIKAWKYKNAWIGPQILSYLSRIAKTGISNLDNDSIRKNLRATVADTLLAVEIAELICNTLSIDLCLVNEPNYSFNGGIVDTLIARNIPVIQYLQPSKDNALIFKKLTADTRRVHPASISSEVFNDMASESWTGFHETLLIKEFEQRYNGSNFLQSRNQVNAVLLSSNDIIKKLDIPEDKKVACVFCPVLWDANLFYGEDLFKDFADWLLNTVKAAVSNDNLIWLIKLHPANIWKLSRENQSHNLSDFDVIQQAVSGEFPRHIRILSPDCGISTLSLFNFIDYGITVRGTTGMELPCFGKPTLVAGTGRYSGLGFTIDSVSAEEYLNRLADLHNYAYLTEEQTLLAKKHALAIFRRRSWIMKSFKSSFNYPEKGSHPLDHDLYPLVKSFEEIYQNQDLYKWAEWAGQEKVDFLEEL